MGKADSLISRIDTINEWVGKVCSFTIIAIMFIAFIEVASRYVFSRPTTWAWEINLQLLGVMTFLGAGYTLLHDRHVKLDLLIQRLSPRKRAIVNLVTGLFFFFVCFIIIYESIQEAWHSVSIREHLYTVFAPPVYPLKCLLPIGVFLLFLQGLANFVRNIIILTRSKGESRFEP